MSEAVSSWAKLVPELSCSDLVRSKRFYVDVLGFRVRFAREGFVYLERDGAELMLEQVGKGWLTGPLEAPFGRGLNLQIEVEDAAQLAERLVAHNWPLFSPIEENWYRTGDVENGQQEFLVQDPDGYLLRFAQWLGERPF